MKLRLISLLSILLGACASTSAPPGRTGASTSTAAAARSSLSPPRAAERPKTLEIHGDRREDPYFWLRDRDDPEVIRYLEAENAYAAAQMAPVEPLVRRLFAEMKGRVAEVDTSAPYSIGPYEYYERTEAGRAYAIHCRKKSGGPEEVILDENRLAEGASFFDLGGATVSPDQALIAYSVDFLGNERHTLRIRDIASGRDLDDRLEEVGDGFEWAEDGKTLLYTRLDATNRPDRLLRHTLGTPPAKDVEIYREKEEAFFVSVDKTRSRRFLLVSIQSQVTSEWRFLDAKKPAGPLTMIAPRRQNVEYSVEHQGERFFILTNGALRRHGG